MNNDLKTELADLLQQMQKRRCDVQPRLLLARMQLLAARLESEEVEVPSETFDLLDNDGRRMCLTALLTICAAAIREK